MSKPVAKSAATVLRSLWKRAPLWRFSVMTASLLTLLVVLLPNRFNAPSGPALAPIDAASYHPDSVARPAPPAAPATTTTASAANSAHAATISMATPGGSSIDQTSGLDRALLGRTFQDTLLVEGYKVPLPPGQWAMLANGTVTGTAHPENKGMNYFLGQIVHKRLVAAIWIQAMRSPGLGFIESQDCTNPANLYELDEPAGTDHQGCTWIRSYFSADMQQWADKSAHIDQMARAAGGDLAAKGVSYPQELVMAGFDQSEKWGRLIALYMFSPEKDGVSSNVVPTFRDSDWYKSNLQRYPKKVAYVNKLQQWATGFLPKVRAAFDSGKQTGVPPAALPATAPAPAPSTTVAAANAPHSATTSTAAPGGSIDQTSGLDRALLGRTFQDTLLVNGYKVPLPPGQWAMLVNGTLTTGAHPENKGTLYFLGQIVQKRLVAAVVIRAWRSPGLGFTQEQDCTNPANLYQLDQPEETDHQGCTWIRSYFSADMQQWADKSSHIDPTLRAVGENLAAKGVSYPQELVTAGFDQAEKWGQLVALYMFSPEKDGISSNVVAAFRDSDWTKSNLQRYPEKVAYVNKLQQWVTGFLPKFQAAFAGGKQTGD
jgi:hypothetical protein